jgi:beta-glucosidase
MRKIVFAAALVCSLVGSTVFAQLFKTAEKPKPVSFTDRDAPVEARIDDLLKKMTLEEKIAAFSTNPSVPRLGVVGTGHVEGLHGLALGGPGHWEGHNGEAVIPTTTFPQSRGLGQTWDPALLKLAAAQEAYEVRYAFGKYHRGGLVVRAPNADLSRDPRWGRSEESYGEDPYLVGKMATAYTEGLQGTGKYWVAASLLKHFLANSNEDGRDSSSSNFDTRLFHEYYSVPFRMAIEDGHANAMMTSYNSWNGIPMTENPVLRDVVMRDWGFNGILCTDAGALTNMVKASHVFNTLPEATAAAVHAGINQFLDKYQQGMKDALAQGLLSESDLDRNLRGVYRVMIKLGLLDGAAAAEVSKIGLDDGAVDPWMKPEPKALARKVTDESIVLLKNQPLGAMPEAPPQKHFSFGLGKAAPQPLLPLDAAKLKTIAVIGPLADKVELDWYSGTPPYTVTPLAGIRERVGTGVHVTYADGSDLAAAAALAKSADVAIVLIGNNPTCGAGWNKCPLPSDGKEAIDRKSLTLEQEEIAKAVYAANPKTIVVLQASFPFTTNWTQQNVPAIVAMTHNSEEQGNGLADVLFGNYNPAGRLTQTWVKDMADLPPMMDYNIRDGRTYLYAKQAPLYAFGYGLSYTTFQYAHLHLSTDHLRKDETVTVRVEVKNTGKRDGDEVVQMYVKHVGSNVPRPVEELKGFVRTRIKSGETSTVEFPLAAKDLCFWDDATRSWVLEPDKVEVMVGGSSDKLPLNAMLQVLR